MAPHGERSQRIIDLAHDIGKLDYTKNDLRKYLGPEMGALNVKQTEAIITLIEMVRGIILALGALNKEMGGLTIDEGEIRLAVGDAAIYMKRDGSVQIKGKNINVRGAGKVQIKGDGNVEVHSGHDIEINAAHELHFMGEKVE
jgi:hypothetical protein